MRIVDSLLTSEGDGAEVKRLFPLRAGRMNHDPFVLWDHFYLKKGTGFPTHPHRGFEAITYIFEGSMEHKDNLGNHSRVYENGAQRFTAGKGIEHSEMPDKEGNTTGIQLWINLPRRLKMLDPDYQQVDAENIPVQKIDGGVIRTIVGEGSALKLHTPVQYLDISLQQGATFTETIDDNYQGLLYVVEGELKVGKDALSAGKAVYIEEQDSVVEITSLKDSRFMLCIGKPHKEPIHQWGPFVD
ncbi:MAG: pirin family protein [Gammaproteobacteria bacterium]|jgi:redox-sensitive bicupin YhaK (pirin superfamily)